MQYEVGFSSILTLVPYLPNSETALCSAFRFGLGRAESSLEGFCFDQPPKPGQTKVPLALARMWGQLYLRGF